MFKLLSIPILGAILYLGCDSTTSPTEIINNSPRITSISLTPQNFTFIPSEGFKDTTVNLQVQINLDNIIDEVTLIYAIVQKGGIPIFESSIKVSGESGQSYTENIEIATTTTTIQEYVFYVLVDDESGNGNYAESNFSIKGFSNDPPQILEANNPAEVKIPSGDEIVNFFFTAKVTDPDGQDNIERVFIEFINEDGTRLIPNPNSLLDNGLDGDQVAKDSVYTIGFSINSSNTPNNRTVQYIAIDKAGLSSDTLETQFNIVN